MHVKLGARIVAFAVLLLAAPTIATDRSAPRTAVAACGNLPYGIYEVASRHISCVRARQVVRQWLSQCDFGRDNPCLTTSRFFCRATYLSLHENTYRCVYEPDRYKPRVSQRAVRFFLRG